MVLIILLLNFKQWRVCGVWGYSPFPDTWKIQIESPGKSAQGRQFQLQRCHQRVWQRERLGESTRAVSEGARAGCDQPLGGKTTPTTRMTNQFSNCFVGILQHYQEAMEAMEAIGSHWNHWNHRSHPNHAEINQSANPKDNEPADGPT